MPQRFYRRVINIAGADSPNVRLAQAQINAGLPVTNEVIVPGVLTYDEYVKRLSTWDKIRICIGVYGQFYEGSEIMLYPADWLNLAAERANSLSGWRRIAEGIGVDTAEGGDKTAMAAVDRYGLIDLVSEPTPDTNVIPGKVLSFARRWGIYKDNDHPNIKRQKGKLIGFDRGGGGKEHADRLRGMGFDAQTIGFGEAPVAPVRRSPIGWEEQQDVKEERYVYVNRRAQMYHELRLMIDPSLTESDVVGEQAIRFAIPAKYEELRRQLTPLPLWHNEEGRIYLPPKHHRTGDKDARRITIEELIGCSPDESDALVLAIHVMRHKITRIKIGALV